MKNLLLFISLALAGFLPQTAHTQCNAAFTWEQFPNMLKIQFHSQSTSEHDIISHLWNFGDNHNGDGVHPMHTYSEPGVYLVCLTITDNEGCVDDICHEVVVQPINNNICEAAFTFEINQQTNTVFFNDNSFSNHDIISWLWEFGDGETSDDENPTHHYPEAGTYEVCLTITDNTGCTDDVCHAVTILEEDDCEAFFTIQETGDPFTFNFNDESVSDHDIAQWIWDFGDDHDSDDQDPTHTYDQEGTYEVCLTIVSETGCEDHYCTVLVVQDNGGDDCHAEFTFEHNQNGNVWHFFDQSTSDHDIATWQWNFGDGGTSTEQNPVHEYDNPGTYTVCLLIISETGCVADHCETIVVPGEDDCHAEFTFDVDGNLVHFFDQSTSEHDIVSWQWIFGDGHNGDGQNPVHEYAPGTYTVCLIITSETGCVADHCETIVVPGGDGCHAEFGFEHNQNGNVWHFFDQSTSEHQIVSWSWSFGDGGTSTEENPVHEYANPGTYTVCLLIITETGCVSDHCETIVVPGGDGCHAEFSFDVDGNLVHFFDQSTSEHDIVSWVWHFGDGHNGDGQNPVHEYDTAGTYTVCLIITSETGCVADHCEQVVVGENNGEGCNALFTFEVGNEWNVHFFNQSTSEHDIIQFIWNFGDGHMGDGQNPVHFYDQPGTYEVCLTIVDNAGCEDTYCHIVFVGAPPCVAEFTWEFNEDTDSLQFINQSSGSTPNTIWLWNFDDGNFSIEENPQHEYEENGIYNICLFMIDTTTNCSTHECHVYVHDQQPMQGNWQQEEEEEQQNLLGNPTIRFTNPADNNLIISLQLAEESDTRIYMYDLTGKQVLSHNVGSMSPGRHTHSISLPDLPQGLYSLLIDINSKRTTHTLLIMR